MAKEEDRIIVDHVYKSFDIYMDKANSLKEKMLFWNRNRKEKREVLKDINLTIKNGEAVGLIGVNGSGKSTLLKLMTKIIYPNKGKIITNGKLTSLLELGAGFHPDFSGRENIYFNASIFGLTKKQIDSRLDNIIEFSELGAYIDNPVRTYSSGMYMRLAFAVAINVDADILLVDEVLAVGDQHFQEKCIAKMKELKEQGKTMVFVTHSLGTVKDFCNRAIWLNQGEIQMDGEPDPVIDAYLKATTQNSEERNNQINLVKDLYNYRELLKTNIKKDVGGKYKNSVLGVLWSFINPLLQIAVYALVFQVILKSDIDNYTVYLCCGLIPWQYFSSVVLRGAATIIDNGNIIKKVYFPREILPISVVTSEGVNFLISTIIILGFVIFGGIGLSWNILWYFLIFIIQFIVSIGVAFIVSSLTVYFRDLQHLLGIFMQLLFYATPIVYAISSVPAGLQWIVKINPMSYLIEGYRAIFYNRTMPDFQGLLIALAMGIVLCLIGYFVFKKLEKKFAEEL